MEEAVIQAVENLFQIMMAAARRQQALGAAFAARRVNTAAHRRPESVGEITLPGLARRASPEDSRQKDFRQGLENQRRSFRQQVGHARFYRAVAQGDGAAQSRKGMEPRANTHDG